MQDLVFVAVGLASFLSCGGVLALLEERVLDQRR